MSKSRRDFLTQTSLGLIGAAVATNSSAQVHAEEIFQEPTPLPPGAPPAFGAGPAVGPEVSPATFAEAEKLVQVNLTPADRARAAESWRVNLASLYERRTGPRTIALEPTLAPFSRYHSVLPSQSGGPRRDHFIRTKSSPARCLPTMRISPSPLSRNFPAGSSSTNSLPSASRKSTCTA